MMGLRSSIRNRRGNALIEFSLLMPWLTLLFTGTFDCGFYTFSLISIENAARAAALRASANSATASDQAGACAIVLQELRGLPNVPVDMNSSCNSAPIQVTASYCDASTACSGSTASADGQPAAYISVTYQLPPLFHFPLTGLQSVTRTVEMRLRDIAQ